VKLCSCTLFYDHKLHPPPHTPQKKNIITELMECHLTGSKPLTFSYIFSVLQIVL
jgi:hypothetical protein